MGIHLLCGVGYICLIAGGLPMPRFYETVSQDDTKVESGGEQQKKTKHSKLTLILSFFYFAFSCGLEGFFQSQTFTFGICGPHKMAPGKAATLTTVYFASFLAGRYTFVTFIFYLIQFFWSLVVDKTKTPHI